MVATAEGRFEDAVRHLGEASRRDPADAETQQRLTLATAALGRASEARRQANALTGPAGRRLAAARTFEQQGKFDDAERAYRDAVRLDSSSADARDALGYLLLQRGTFAEAVTHLTEAVRLRPDAGASHASLAYALREVGRLDDSITAYRRAIEFPEIATRAGVRNNFGITLAMAGRAVEARAEFREALRLDPSLPGVQENLAKIGGP
jgi:Flp pilus assembly protein TadD